MSMISTQNTEIIPSNENDEYFNRMHISDEVHDYIEIPEKLRIIIDTPEFQRLRELKQLGATYFVFPGASHNRFEHSLGVMHLAMKLLKHLRMNQPELKITDNELYCISAAGLLHDLGHGPFSHVFDNEFVPSIISSKFRHEDMSIKLIKKLFVDNTIKIDQPSLDLICALVSPSTHKHIVDEYKSAKRGFLFEIIANESNGIDVDKWDYFLRDSHNLSLDISFKYTRLLTHCRVIDDHICFHDKTNYDVQILFNTRYDLFKRVYSHKTSKAVEYMICDVLKYANPKFKITDKIHEAKDFMELTDNIIHRIQWYPIVEHHNTHDRNINNGLKKAQQLIHRIHTRKLYKCAGYILLESSVVARHFVKLNCNLNNKNNNNNDQDDEEEDDDIDDKDDGTASYYSYDSYSNTHINYRLIANEWKKQIFDILIDETNNFANCNGDKLEEDDILCQLMSLSYGMESVHPIQRVYFYNGKSPNISHLADMDQITTLHDPAKFREVICRLYVKNELFVKQCEKAFKIFCANKELINPNQLKQQTSLGLSPKKIKTPSPPRIDKTKNKIKKSQKRKLDQMFENEKSPSPLTPNKKQKLIQD